MEHYQCYEPLRIQVSYVYIKVIAVVVYQPTSEIEYFDMIYDGL